MVIFTSSKCQDTEISFGRQYSLTQDNICTTQEQDSKECIHLFKEDDFVWGLWKKHEKTQRALPLSQEGARERLFGHRKNIHPQCEDPHAAHSSFQFHHKENHHCL